MCSYIVEKASMTGSAKGPNGWMNVDSAIVYFDHPYHAKLDHALAIDFVDQSKPNGDRVAIEISAASARRLIAAIEAALAQGVTAHGHLTHGEAVELEPASNG